MGTSFSRLLTGRGFVRRVEGVIPTRFWQQVKKGDQVYYVDTDTFEKTTEQPHEYVPAEAMESRMIR